MQLFSLGKTKSIVGLDIGSSSVKAVECAVRNKRVELLHVGVAPIPAEAIVQGAFLNSGAIVEAIREAMDSAGIKTKTVATAVSGHSVIVKKISLPSMTREELEESIRWEAEQYIPFDINEVNLDFQILHGAEMEGQMDVLLVAAKKDLIDDYVHVITDAGLTPAVIDVAAFAVENAFEANYDLRGEDVVALVNIGSQVVNINIVANGAPAFTRDISTGGSAYTEEIQKALSVSWDEAERMKIGGRGEGDAQDVVPQEVEEADAQRHRHRAGRDQPLARLLRRHCGREPHRQGLSVGRRRARLRTRRRLPAQDQPAGRTHESALAGHPGVAPGRGVPQGDRSVARCRHRARPAKDGRLMIRINLLPVREERRKASARQLALVLAATLLGSVLLSGAFHGKVRHDISSTRAQTLATQKEIDRFEPQLKQVEEFKKAKAEIEQKLGVIESLHEARSGPVHVLDELATHTPDRIWISKVSIHAGKLTLEGMSLDNELVALFLTALEESALLQGRRARRDAGQGEGRLPAQRLRGERRR